MNSRRGEIQDVGQVMWMIEVGVFPRTAPRLIEALERRGVAWVRYEEGQTPAPLPPEGARVIFWGSLGAAYEQRVAARWVPGAVGEVERFRCSVYQQVLGSMLGPVLANPDAVFTTVRELVDEPRAVLARLGEAAGATARVFVRPDSALKPFAGRKLAIEALSRAALDHGFYYDDDELPIVVSTVKRIGREWRFVIAEGVVVAGCEYDVTRQGRALDVPEAARALADRVAGAAWQAAPLYVVDVGEVDGTPRVMELNPFSGADLYDRDPDAVITAAIQVAAESHERAAEPTP